jgi:hypothetical protein
VATHSLINYAQWKIVSPEPNKKPPDITRDYEEDGIRHNAKHEMPTHAL